MVARLKDGVSLQAAAQDTDRVAHEIMRNFPATNVCDSYTWRRDSAA